MPSISKSRRIRETVSEPRLGEIRLAWWRDTISGLFAGTPGDHPVAQALMPAITAGGLPITPFLSLIESRQFDLYDDPMPTLGDLEGYLGETSSAILQLGVMILAGGEAARLAEASGFAGVAYGLTGLLRSLPVHRARGQCYVPKDVLAKHGLTPAQWLSAREGQKAAMVVARSSATMPQSGFGKHAWRHRQGLAHRSGLSTGKPHRSLHRPCSQDRWEGP